MRRRVTVVVLCVCVSVRNLNLGTGASRGLMSRAAYVTVHAKTLRKSAKIFVELRADFASPIFILHLLQISCG